MRVSTVRSIHPPLMRLLPRVRNHATTQPQGWAGPGSTVAKPKVDQKPRREAESTLCKCPQHFHAERAASFCQPRHVWLPSLYSCARSKLALLRRLQNRPTNKVPLRTRSAAADTGAATFPRDHRCLLQAWLRPAYISDWQYFNVRPILTVCLLLLSSCFMLVPWYLFSWRRAPNSRSRKIRKMAAVTKRKEIVSTGSK